MAEVPQVPYNRNLDFLDKGITDLQNPVYTPLLPNKATTGILSTKDAFTSIFSQASAPSPYVNYTTPYRTPLEPTLRYNDPVWGYDPFNPNLEYQYGDRQGAFQKWKNNFLKFGANTVGSFVEALATIPLVLDAISTGKTEDIYNNDLTNGITDWINNLETTLPNYETTFGKNHPVLNWIPFVGNSGDSWGSLLKSLGYTAGSIAGAVVQDAAVGALTEGVGELPLIPGQIMKSFGKLGKIFSAEKGASTGVLQALKTGVNVERAVDEAAAAIRLKNQMRYGLSLGTSALSESAFEANQTYKNIQKTLTDDYFQTHGYDASGDAKKQIEDYANGGATADLFANTALLSVTNGLVFGSVLKPFGMAQKGLTAELTANIGLKQGAVDVFENIVRPANKFKMLTGFLDKVSRPVRTSLIEGVEEGSQYVFQRSAEDYYKRKFDNNSIEDVDNFYKSLSTGLKDVFTTREGLENIFMGILSGTVIHAGRNVIEARKGLDNHKNALINSTLSILNSQKVSGLFRNTYSEAVTAHSLTKAMERALRTGDVFEYKNLQLQQLFNFVESGVRANRFDLRLEQLQALKELEPNEFQKMFGINFTQSRQKTAAAFVDEVINKAHAIKENIDKVNEAFTNPYEKNTNNYFVFEEYKSQLALDLSEIHDNRRRLRDLRTDVADIIPTVNMDDVVKLTNDKGVNETIQSFQKRVDELNKSIEILDDKKSDIYKESVQERDWLQEKIGVLQSNLQEYNPDLYLKEVEDLLNYYANGKTFKQDELVLPIEALESLNRAQDAFKLINNINRALYHYQQLTNKKGYSENFANIVAEYALQDKKFEDSDILKDENQLNQTGTPAVEDVEELDKNGNVITRPTKTAVAEIQKQIDDLEQQKRDIVSGAIASADQPVDVQYNGKTYRVTPDKISEVENEKEFKADLTAKTKDEIEALAAEARKPKAVERIDQEIATLKATIPPPAGSDVLSGGDSNEVIPDFEDDPTIKAGAQKAQDSRKGVQKNSIKYVANPFVLFNKVFSRDYEDGVKEKKNLWNVLFSLTPAQIYKKLTIKLKESTLGQKADEYREFKPFDNLYYKGHAVDIELYHEGKIIGRLQPADRLVFKRGDAYVPLYEITPEEYEAVTKNEPSTYNDFINEVKSYKAITDRFLSDFSSGKVEFNNKEVQSVFDIMVNYGGIQFAKSELSATKLADVNYKNKGNAVISLPTVYNKETGVIERTTRPTVINQKELSDADQKAIWEYIADNIEKLRNIDSRYIYIVKMPDGKYSSVSAIAARPAESNQTVLDNILAQIKEVAGAISKPKLNELNLKLREGIYIADSRNRKGNKSAMNLSMNDAGDLYINIFNEAVGYRKRIKINEAKSAQNFEGFVDAINEKLLKTASKDPALDRLNLSLDRKDFKNGILQDEDVTMAQLGEALTIAASPDIFKDFSITVLAKVQAEPAATPQPKATPKFTKDEEALLGALQDNLESITGIYKNVIKGGLADPNTHSDVLDTVLQQYADNYSQGESIFGKAISDKITALLPGLAKQEANAVNNFQEAPDKKGLSVIFSRLFGLSSRQADAVAEVYDRTAEAWAARMNSTPEAFYKNLKFAKATEKELIGDDILKQLEPEPLIRALFRKKNFEPIGRSYTTGKTARERFNISELNKQVELGEGSDRIVYDLGDGKVVKIAKTARGLYQNDTENDGELIKAGLIPNVYEVGDNYIIVEKVEPADIYDYDVQLVNKKWFVVGTSQVSYLVDPDDQKFIEAKDQKDAIAKKQKLQEANIPRRFLNEFEAAKNFEDEKRIVTKYGLNADILYQYPFLRGDFVNIANWGIKNGKIIHLDGGTFDNTFIDKFKGKKNLEDEDFKIIREKTQELKKKFGDKDNSPYYQSLSKSAIIASVVKGFGLQKVEGVGNLAYKTERGSATPNLATKINQWLQDNGYNDVRFVYEGVNGTVNPFIREDNLLFQNNSITANKVKNKINKLPKEQILKHIENIIEEESGLSLKEFFNNMDFSEQFFDNAIQNDIRNKDLSLYGLAMLYNELAPRSRSTKIEAINTASFLSITSEAKTRLFNFLSLYGITKADLESFYGENVNDRVSRSLVRELLDRELNEYTEINGDLVRGGSVLNQSAKGAIRLMDDGSAIIYALSKPDVSTPLHELAHFWERQLTDAERKDVLEWAGNQEWSRETSEKFARGFEKYLADGEAPTAGLQKLFDNFKKWLTKIYQGIVGSDIDFQLNDKMKTIYAAMLGEKFETETKEAVAEQTKSQQIAQKAVEDFGIDSTERWLQPIPADSAGYWGHLSEIQRAIRDKSYDELIKNGTLTEEKLREIIKSTASPENAGISESVVDDILFRANNQTLLEDIDYWKKIPNFDDKGYVSYVKTIKEIIRNGALSEAIMKEAITPEEAEKILKATNQTNADVRASIKAVRDTEAALGIIFRETEEKASKEPVNEEPAAPQPEPETLQDENQPLEVDEKVIYQGKEVTIKEIVNTASGNRMVVISDGTKYGEKPVRPEQLTKIPVVEPEPVFDEGLLKDIQLSNVVKTSEGEITVPTETGKQYENEGEFTESEEDVNNLLIDYVGLKLVLENLKQRFGIPYTVVDKDEAWKGRIENGVVYINLRNVSRDTPFHEYLHPFIAVLKLDNPDLYRSLVEEAVANPLFRNELNEVKADDFYKGKTSEEIGDEALIRFISKNAAKNIDKNARKVQNRYTAAAKRLIERFNNWLYKVLRGIGWEVKTDKKGVTTRKQVEDQTRAGIVSVQDLPVNLTIEDLSDIISLHGMAFDFTSRMDVVKALNEFQTAAAPLATEEDKIIARIKRRLDVLEDTAKRRLPSDVLLSEVRDLRGILKNQDTAESINEYVYQGITALDYANDEFKRITGEVKKGNLTPADVKKLNKSLEVVKNLLVFYEDVNGLFSRITDDLSPREYKQYSIIKDRAKTTMDSIKSRSIELSVEWLYPYVESFNQKIKDKYPEFVVSKEDFKNKLYSADKDSNFLFYWLGSVSSSDDPVSAVTRTALFDIVEENHLYEAELGENLKITYDNFLKRTGIKNEQKTTEEFYRNNYLRKATVLEKTNEKDENGNYKYEYRQKWAFHEEFLYDLYVKDKTDFLEELAKKYGGDIPEVGTPEYQQYVDAIFDWEKTNGSLSQPAEKYRNAKYAELYRKDEFFTKLYETYREGNGRLGEDERLKYGVIPQHSNGKTLTNDIKAQTGFTNKVKFVAGKLVNFVIPKVEEESTFSDTQENLDGTLYRRINAPYVMSLPEDNLSLVLPETVFKFAGSANLVSLMRESEPNIKTLKTVIEGNKKIGIEARKINKVTTDRKTIFDHILKLPARKEEREARLNNQLTAFIDDVVYGQTELQQSVNLGIRKIDMNKLGANWAFLTALNNMAFNITAGIGNVSIGNVVSFGEALGGKYYKPADWTKATGQYFGSMPAFMRDMFDLKKSKITQLGIKYDAIQGEFRDKYGKKFVGNFAQRYASADTLFVINHGAEHQIQLTGMLALMNATKVTTKTGEQISLFDAHIVNEKGFLRLRDDVNWTKENERDFTMRLHGINKMLNGNYSKFDKAHLQRTWLGKLALIYRKFVYNSFRSRYGSKRPDYEIGDVMEGYYRTFFSKLVSDLKAYKLEAISRFFTKRGWNADEAYAYNKTIYELSLLLGVTILGLALSASGDDDKEKSWGQDYLTLQLVRLRSDIGMYSVFGPSSLVNIFKNPTVVLNTLTRYTDFFLQLIKNPFQEYDRKTGAFNKGDSVLKAKLFKAIPIVRQFVNAMQPDEQLKFYQILNKNF